MAAPARLQARLTKAAEETAENIKVVLTNQRRIEKKLDTLLAAFPAQAGITKETPPDDPKTKNTKATGKNA